jgi:adenosylcobinamide-GDP ribazoletransferase
VRAALAFLTPVPVGRGPNVPTGATLAWFPVVGVVLGLAVGGSWWAAAEVFPLGVAAALAVTADLVLTGALHVDGLADAADGLLPHLDGPQRRRAVMATPDVGTFGVAAVGAALLLRWSALASLEPDALLVAGLWCASRSAMVLALARGPYVGGGLGAAFGGGPAAAGWVGLGAGCGLAVLAESGSGAVAVGGLALAALAVVVLGHRRLGGVTGDVLGAAGVAGETVGLVLASASW